MENIMSSMLPGAPWLLAHKSMLQVNQPLKISLQGNDYVLWIDAAGEIQALPNACPHMGAMLSAGWCEHGKIVCPFHALQFDGAGCTVLPGSGTQTLPQLQPLPLVVKNDFIWSYGTDKPVMPIPMILDEIAANYKFMGVTGEYSVQTNLLPMLLNMHDYNHQNGTHRSLFEIEEVLFDRFIDKGHHSHAYFRMPRSQNSFRDILKNPALLTLPKIMSTHLENFFPAIVLFHGTSFFGQFKQCHIFVPESATHTRTYVLVYTQANGNLGKIAARLLRSNMLQLIDSVIQQDADILAKIYPAAPQKVKLNNEIGLDWVHRNFQNFPTVVEPNLSIAPTTN
jgi:phenylpropionate dioxygenase-like ring-hydroxylating dioxygenase large terminal subunit